jgi:hypothetical protein
MADALVFGAPNALANRLADTFSDLFHVRERYQQTLEQNSEPGVAIVTTLAGLNTDAPLLVFADGARKDRKVDDPERRAWLATLAEGAVRGSATFVVTSTDEAARLKAHLKRDGAPKGAPLRRLLVIKQTFEQQLSEEVADALRLPRIVVNEPTPVDDPEAWPVEVADEEQWVVETAYSPAVRSLLDRADLVIVFDLGPVAAPDEATPPLHERLLLGVLRRTYAPVVSPKLERDLSAVAHLTPVLTIRTYAERDTVVDALIRGASLPGRSAS